MNKIAVILFFLLAGFSLKGLAQASYIDLTIVESSNYNQPVANFSFSMFEAKFQITSEAPTIYEDNINKALMLFIDILKPMKSYIIQHEPTYYFVFQYNKKDGRYLVMNNSIGEANEAVYLDNFDQAKGQMLLILQKFYKNIPAVSLKEYR